MLEREQLEKDLADALAGRVVRADAPPMVEAVAELVIEARAAASKWRDVFRMAYRADEGMRVASWQLEQLRDDLQALDEKATAAEREGEAVLRRFRVPS